MFPNQIVKPVEVTVYHVYSAVESRPGPLRVLQQCVTEKLKVKVLTRNYSHVRGICSGYIVAFDKHWNLVGNGVVHRFDHE